jgi:tetratricopeptide (TPR) repeat protein
MNVKERNDPMTTRGDEHVTRAKDILRGKAAELSQLLELAQRLKEESELGYARQILARALEVSPPDRALRYKLAMQYALCTYKDSDLPHARFDQALKILQEVDDLRTTEDVEILGLGGAIYKRRWEMDGQRSYLEQALALYLRAYKRHSFFCPRLATTHAASARMTGNLTDGGMGRLRLNERHELVPALSQVLLAPVIALEPRNQPNNKPAGRVNQVQENFCVTLRR